MDPTVSRMRVPERRRRLLFLAQAWLGVAAVLSVLAVLWALARPGTGIWGPLGVLTAAAMATLGGWGVAALERAKFAEDAREVSPGDWAQQLREVRDSRRVIVEAFEIERRRIERDLHDGAQQYLVSATMKLGEASLLLEQRGDDTAGGSPLPPLLESAHRDAEEALHTLRATVSGIHPQVLTDLGLRSAVVEMAERSGLDVTVRCPHRLLDMPEGVAAVAWFFCSEALTNIAKHAPNAAATLLLAADQELHVSIMDDGPGGAHLRHGGGLSGMRERLAAFGGVMTLSSPQGGPTTLSARIPLLLSPAHENRADA